MRRSTGPSLGNDDREIDRILSREDEILPSSGFTVSVMEAVRREAAAPPPIPFPWKGVLPGLLAGGGALALVLVTVVKAISRVDGTMASTTASRFSSSLTSGTLLLFSGGIESAAIWAGLALLMAFVSVKLTMRLSGQE
jgi:hypothetical protein